VNQTASSGTGSIGSLDFNGAATNPAFLVIDSGASNASTSLKIGTFLGRVANTTGALTIIPRNGGLDSTEAIYAGSIAPAVGPGQNHGILAPYVAAQASASNTSIDFLGITGTSPNNRIGGGAAAYKTDNINLYSNGTAVFFANNVTADINTGGRSLFALKADGTLANVSGNTQTLTLGDGTLAGLIVNNGARVTATNMVINAAEAIFWSGGQVLDVDGTTILSAGGSISSNLSFASTTQGALTTAGAQTLTFSGGFNMGGVSRPVCVFCWLTWYAPTSHGAPASDTSAPCANRGAGRGTSMPRARKTRSTEAQAIAPSASRTLGRTSSSSRASHGEQRASSSGRGAFPGGAQRAESVTHTPHSTSPSSRDTLRAWFASPARCSAAYRKSPDRSPVKTRPVRLPPCAAGARPTTASRARGSPHPGTGRAQ